MLSILYTQSIIKSILYLLIINQCLHPTGGSLQPEGLNDIILFLNLFKYFFDRLVSEKSVNLSESDALFAMSLVAIGNTVSKICCGILCDRQLIGTYEMYTWSHIFSGALSCCIWITSNGK